MTRETAVPAPAARGRGPVHRLPPAAWALLNGRPRHLSRRLLLVSMLVVATFSSTTAAASLAAFTSSATTVAAFTADTWADNIMYLHDDGNATAEITNLPMDTTAPTAALGRYSQNCDYDSLGREIGRHTTTNWADACDSASWITPALAARSLTGPVTLYVWTGVGRFNKINPPFEPDQHYDGTLTITVDRVTSAGTVTNLGNAQIHRPDWQNGSVTWIPDTYTVNVTNYPVAAGDRFRIALSMVSSDSKARAYTAYDAAAYQARLVLP